LPRASSGILGISKAVIVADLDKGGGGQIPVLRDQFFGLSTPQMLTRRSFLALMVRRHRARVSRRLPGRADDGFYFL
jgi:hypothetical protein